MPATIVERTYQRLKPLLVEFDIKPGERLNEGKLAKRLETSRTPLREAMNRLHADGLLSVQAGQGFFCRELTPDTVFQLFETRAVLESSALALSCQRASNEAIDAIGQIFFETPQNNDDFAEQDDEFHLSLARLSRNAVLVNQVGRLCDLTRIIGRCLPAKDGPLSHRRAHRDLLAEVKNRHAQEASHILARHLILTQDEAREAVLDAYGHIFARVN